MYHSVVIDPDEKEVEQVHTGLLYTGVSRGTSLGDADGLHSAVYFQGPNLTKDRIRQLTLTKNGKHEYVKVTKRRDWVRHLDRNTQSNLSTKTPQVAKTFQFFNQPMPYDTLYERKLAYTKT